MSSCHVLLLGDISKQYLYLLQLQLLPNTPNCCPVRPNSLMRLNQILNNTTHPTVLHTKVNYTAISSTQPKSYGQYIPNVIIPLHLTLDFFSLIRSKRLGKLAYFLIDQVQYSLVALAKQKLTVFSSSESLNKLKKLGQRRGPSTFFLKSTPT